MQRLSFDSLVYLFVWNFLWQKTRKINTFNILTSRSVKLALNCSSMITVNCYTSKIFIKVENFMSVWSVKNTRHHFETFSFILSPQSTYIPRVHCRVCPLVGIGTHPPPTPSSASECVSFPRNQRGGGTLACGWGVRVRVGPNSETWKKSSTLSVLCAHLFSVCSTRPIIENMKRQVRRV